MAPAGAREEREHPHDRDGCREGDEHRRRREQPERDPGVLHAVDRERAEYVNPLVRAEVRSHEMFRRLVADERRDRDYGEPGPLR